MTEPTSDAYSYFARQLAHLQRERGLSTEALAERSGLDRADLELILGGEGKVGADTVLLLAVALEVEPGDLLNGLVWVRDGRGGGHYRIRGLDR